MSALWLISSSTQILKLISIFCGKSFFRQLLFFLVWWVQLDYLIWLLRLFCLLSLLSLNLRLDWSLLVEMEGVFLRVHEWRGHRVQQLSTNASWVIHQGVMWWKWSLWWYGWAGNVHAVLREEGNRDYMSTSSPLVCQWIMNQLFRNRLDSDLLWSALMV